MLKKPFINVLRVVAAVVPFVWIAWRIDLTELSRAVGTTRWWSVVILVIAVLAGMFLQGVRWWVLLRAFVPDLSLGTTLRYHYRGLFFSVALPTSGAQDVVRTVLISSKVDYSVAWGATWLCRIAGLTCLALFAAYGLLAVGSDVLPKGVAAGVLATFATLGLFGLLSFSKRTTRPFRALIGRVMPEKALGALEKVREGIYQYRTKKVAMLLMGLITVVIQAILVIVPAFVILGITGRFLLVEYLAFGPLIEIICMSAPLTPGGVGVKEALVAVMFRQMALSNEHLGIYVALGLLGVVLKLVGGLALIGDAKQGHAEEDARRAGDKVRDGRA